VFDPGPFGETVFDPSLCAGLVTRPGNIQVSTTTDVTDLAGVQCITGNLTVSAAVIADLTGLESLKYVGGNLSIINNTGTTTLTALAGLSGLVLVGGALDIEGNTQLRNISGLGSLVDLGGALTLSNNAALVSAFGLHSLAVAGGAITVSSNPILTGLGGGLESLNRVQGKLTISGTAFTSLTELAALTYAGGLVLTNNASLPTLSLAKLAWVAGNADFTGDSAITLLDLNSLLVVTGSLTVTSETKLPGLSLPKLVYVDQALTVSADPILSALSMPALGHVGGKLTLLSLPVAAVQLPKLYSGGGIHLDTLSALVSVELPNLATLSLEFYVGYCTGTTSPAFDVPYLTSADSFTFERDGFSTIAGFPLLASLAHDLVIQSNAQLTQLAALQSMTSVGGSIYILANPLLQSLAPLSNIQSVVVMLQVQSDAALTDFTMDVAGVTSEAVINGNAALMTVHLPDITSGPVYIQSDPALVCASAPLHTGILDFGNGKQVPACP
jgi:hypothetical protein